MRRWGNAGVAAAGDPDPDGEPHSPVPVRPADPAANPKVGEGFIELASYPCRASYQGDADVRGKTAFQIGALVGAFRPTVLTGSPGQTLDLTITEVDLVFSTAHTFTISSGGQAIDERIPARGQATVRITFPASGSLAFYCKPHARGFQGGELRVAA